MTATFIYVTASSYEDAHRIGNAVVAERLAACANLLPGVTSMFWWEGRVQEASEVTIILKTRNDLVERLTDRVRELHPYECPCIVALPITGGNGTFIDWIISETS
ncbi:MAG: divalent-cation tolerance protein CutA [Hyphomicrobium sp.]|jgi:periplasmic divalent cation tolerance protein